MNDEHKRISLTAPFIIIGFAAVVFVTAMLLMGDNGKERADRVNQKVTILTVGLAVSMVVISASFPIRQWRRGEEKPETVREIIKDGTQRVKEIHYGAPPKYEIGQARDVSPWAYPQMVQAAYQAGATGSQHNSYAPMIQRDEWDWQNDAPAAATDGVDDVPPPQGWNGEIVM